MLLFHGVLSDAASMTIIGDRIKQKHPGTEVYIINKFNNWQSLENAHSQIDSFFEDLSEIFARHPEGVHILGYSQGGLLARGLIQFYNNHNVKTFVSLSSPQAGQYGSAFLHLIFPNLANKNAYELFYSRVGQRTSVGNYWNDPNHRELYLKYSQYLPYVNNEILCENSTQFRENLLRLEKMVLIGGPDDDVITPWQSAQFGFYDENLEVVPLHERSLYLEDAIGLKTLDEQQRLKIITVPGIIHIGWHLNVTLIDQVVIPHFD